MKLDRGSYLILEIMQKCGAADFIQALTINEIAEKERISKTNTIYKNRKTKKRACLERIYHLAIFLVKRGKMQG